MMWLEAQFKFAEILEAHAPLLEQMRMLQSRNAKLKRQMESLPAPPPAPELPSFTLSRLGGTHSKTRKLRGKVRAF